MRKILIICAAGAALALTACVTSGTPGPQSEAKPIASMPAAAKPSYQAGTKLEYVDRGTAIAAELVSTTSDGDTWRESDGCSWTEPQMFAPATSWNDCGGNSGKAKVGAPSGSLWPLQVGNKASWSVSGDKWQTVRACHVTAAESVKVPAGDFDTFKVVCSDDYSTRTWYYSPVLGATVAYTRVHKRRGLEAQYELAKLPNAVSAACCTAP